MAETVLVDLASDVIPPSISMTKRVACDGLIISRAALHSNPGSLMGATQFSLLVHEGAPFKLTWRSPDGGRQETYAVETGHFFITPADQLVQTAWQGTRGVLAVALEPTFIAHIVGAAYDGRVPQMRARAAMRDHAIEELAVCLRRTLAEHAHCNRLYLEHMAALLALRLFATYGEGTRRTPPVLRGGLGGSRRRRIVDYIEANLDESISLHDLAAEAGLSPHHFGKAFKASLGTTPCRYLSERRILRAKQMLLDNRHSIAEIAYAVGFSSHSHFAEAFRRLAGTTPSQFRKDRC